MRQYYGKIIDVHTHIFPAKIAAKATAAIGEFYDLPMTEVGIRDKLVSDMNEFGIEHCFIHSTATVPSQVRNINNFLIETLKTDKERFTAFGTVHADMEDVIGEIDYMRSNGITGIKFHNDFQRFPVNDPRLDPVYEKCQAEKIPLMFHAGDKRYEFTNPYRFVEVGRKFPQLIGIAAHFGGYSEWKDVGDDMCRSPFWFDTSSSLFELSKEEALRIISMKGEDYIMYGTDFPMWKAGDEYERIEALGLPDRILEKIMYKNAENFMSRFTD